MKLLLSLLLLLPGLCQGQPGQFSVGAQKTSAFGAAGWYDSRVCFTTNFYFLNLAATTTDIFTCPSGKKAIVLGGFGVTTNSSTSVSPFAKIGGSYFRLNNAQTISTSGSGLTVTAFCLEAGESFAITASLTGFNGRITVLLFPDTVPVKSPRIVVPTTMSQVLYTVPASTRAHFWLAPTSITVFVSGNDSGGTRSTTSYYIPSGSSEGVPTLGTFIGNVSNNQIQSGNITFAMEAGDSITLFADSAASGHWYFMTIYEESIW